MAVGVAGAVACGNAGGAGTAGSGVHVLPGQVGDRVGDKVVTNRVPMHNTHKKTWHQMLGR
jgi:hypothetical protein